MRQARGPRPRTRRASARGAAIAGAALIAAAGCGRTPDPVEQTVRDLERYPEYAVIIEDLKVEDGFFPDYFLRLRLMTASGQRVAGKDTLVYEDRVTDWLEVEEEVMARYQHYLGMVVAGKTLDGRRTTSRQAHPPGYQYVGNSQYGTWGAGRVLAVLRPVRLHERHARRIRGWAAATTPTTAATARSAGLTSAPPARGGGPSAPPGRRPRRPVPTSTSATGQRSAGGRGFATRTSSVGGRRFGK